jgi:hypothetical protein
MEQGYESTFDWYSVQTARLRFDRNWILPEVRHVQHHGWSVIVIAGWLQVSLCKATQLVLMIIALLLRWLANRAALEAMDQLLPPRPVLFIRLVLILKPSRFRQLFSNLWVTHPILHPPLPSLTTARSRPDTQSVGGDPNAVP